MPDVIPGLDLDDLHRLPKVQQPTYDDPAEAAEVVARLRALPPLVYKNR